MKDFSDITALVLDFGTFISLADKLSKRYKKVYYHSPVEAEYRDCKDCVIGDNIHRVERVDDYLDPYFVTKLDLVVVPDIGFNGTQKLFRSLGIAVWGSMGADSMELYRTKFLRFLEENNLPIIHSEKIVGLTNLALYLKECTGKKWVKINRFRENMETWKHESWPSTERMLEHLAMEFGGIKEHIVFVVQDDQPTEIEIGYDGWTVDGGYPKSSFSGYEKKNELYLGSLLPYDKLPEPVREINEEIAQYFKDIEYRNFMATEIRVVDGTPYFIDPTFRMPGQTGEQLLETCDNLDEVIWKGANGELIAPQFRYQFSAEATLHYDGCPDHWKTVVVPGEVEQWFKPVHYCICDGAHQFPPAKNDEIGVVLGVGDTIQEAIDHLHENLEFLEGQPVSARTEGFVDLIKSIEEAEKEGIEFTSQEIPRAADMVDA
jgi:hypothetical protein